MILKQVKHSNLICVSDFSLFFLAAAAIPKEWKGKSVVVLVVGTGLGIHLAYI